MKRYKIAVKKMGQLIAIVESRGDNALQAIDRIALDYGTTTTYCLKGNQGTTQLGYTFEARQCSTT